VPTLGKIMVGAKLGLISLEAAFPEDDRHPSLLAEFFGDMTRNIMIAARIALSPISLSAQPFIDASQQLVKGATILLNTINKITTVTAQLVVQIPKSCLEISVTLLSNILKTIDFFRAIFVRKNNHAIPLVSATLDLKSNLLMLGYDINFQIRDHSSYPLERIYCRVAQRFAGQREQEHDYRAIIAKLNIVEGPSIKPSPPLKVFPYKLSDTREAPLPKLAFSKKTSRRLSYSSCSEDANRRNADQEVYSERATMVACN
jgi:hypothetical protein